MQWRDLECTTSRGNPSCERMSWIISGKVIIRFPISSSIQAVTDATGTAVEMLRSLLPKSLSFLSCIQRWSSRYLLGFRKAEEVRAQSCRLCSRCTVPKGFRNKKEEQDQTESRNEGNNPAESQQNISNGDSDDLPKHPWPSERLDDGSADKGD